MSEFHFLRPEWLWLVFPLLVLWVGLWLSKRRQGSWNQVCDPHLLKYMLKKEGGKTSRLPLVGLAVLWLIATLIMAGPTWEKRNVPLYIPPVSTIFVLDLSPTMLATDMKPSRLERAKLKLRDMLKEVKDGQSALVVFSSQAFVVSPLTNDANTIAQMVPVLAPSIMPVGGNSPSAGLKEAENLLKQANAITHAHVILMTDTSGGDKTRNIVESLHSAGATVSVMGVGTNSGAPIPGRNGQFLTDQTGEIILAKLDTASLKSLAKLGGGLYTSLTSSDQDIKTLLVLKPNHSVNQAKKVDQKTQHWIDGGAPFILIILVIAAFAFRTGAYRVFAGVLLPVGLMSMPMPGHAASLWENLWYNQNQQAAQLLDEQKPNEAAKKFEEPNWQGIAYYRGKDFKKALEAFNKEDTSLNNYNKGNTLAQMGQYQKAIDAYEKSLQQKPDNADAKVNIELMKKLLEQKKQQKNQQQQNQNDKDKKDQKDQKQNQDQKQKDQKKKQSKSGQGKKNQLSQDNKEQSKKDKEKQNSQKNQSQQQDQSEAQKKQKNQNESEKDEQEKPPNKKDKKQEQLTQAQKEQLQKAREKEDSRNKAQQAQMKETPQTKEQKQALKQWLRQIPDDPGGLLRREFRRQYIERMQK